jgi:CMP-N-acetylneuraminic acid synthetase
MYKGKRILGIITARGGSKGIPRKNIMQLSGKPLISYTIEAAQKSQYLTRTIVSTEDPEIAHISKSLGADVPFMRPQALAEDTTTSIAVVQHAITELLQKGETFDYVMILQPTSPLRTAEDIDQSIQKIVDTGADSVMSMVQLSDFSIKKLKKIENDEIHPLLEEEGTQSVKPSNAEAVWKRNAAIYLTKTELLMKGDLFGKISRPHIMPREQSVDINDMFDVALAQHFLRHRL